MSSREAEKAAYELRIFREFAERACLKIQNDTIRNGDHLLNQPDILYEDSNGMTRACELGRLRDGLLSAVINSRYLKNGQYVRTSDPSGRIAAKKLKKIYIVSVPKRPFSSLCTGKSTSRKREKRSSSTVSPSAHGLREWCGLGWARWKLTPATGARSTASNRGDGAKVEGYSRW